MCADLHKLSKQAPAGVGNNAGTVLHLHQHTLALNTGNSG